MSTPETKAATLARLKQIAADLNDTSPECLSTLDAIKIIELELELQQAQAALAAMTNERDVFRKAQKICEDCDAPTVAEVAELRAQLAVCQSREAKALEEKERIQLRLDQLRNYRGSLVLQAEADRDQLQAQVGALKFLIQGTVIPILDWDRDLTDAETLRCHDGVRLRRIALRQCQAALAQPPAAPDSAKDGALYPCDKCGTLRTKAEGGTTFTICDKCWDDLHAAMAATPPKAP